MIVLGQQMTIEALHPLTSNTKLLKEAMTKGKQFETKCIQLIGEWVLSHHCIFD